MPSRTGKDPRRPTSGRKFPNRSSFSKHETKATGNVPGQHLLIDRRLVKRLVDSVENSGEDLVVDIGAGAGALTVPLADEGWRVVAVERDDALAAKLERRLGDRDNVRILRDDILRVHLPRKPFRVVSNVPFSITTPIIGRLLDNPSGAFQGGSIIVELGAAYRFTATPIVNTRILGWRTWFDLDITQSVSPTSFSPPPRVNAAVLKITRRAFPPVHPTEKPRYMGLVSACLRYPGVALFQALSGIFTAEQVRRLIRNLHVDRNAPVCSLNPDGWAFVYDTMRRYVEPRRWPAPEPIPRDHRQRRSG